VMELHWTGAALLLAVAVLGPGSRPARRKTIVDWPEFAREHGLAADEPSLAPDRDTPVAAPAFDPPATVRELEAPSRVQRPRPPGGTRQAGAQLAAALAPTERATDSVPYLPQPAAARRAARMRATATCGHCGREAGDLEWDAATPTPRAILRPAGARLRCEHCGGPVFAEEAEPVVAAPTVGWDRPRRGRPGKATRQAS
jgi:hypothetical protein